MNINLGWNHQIEPKNRLKMHRHIIHITNKQDKFRIKINSKVKKIQNTRINSPIQFAQRKYKKKKSTSWKIVWHAKLSDSPCNFT